MRLRQKKFLPGYSCGDTPSGAVMEIDFRPARSNGRMAGEGSPFPAGPEQSLDRQARRRNVER